MPNYIKSNKDIIEMLSYGEPHISNVREEIMVELSLSKNCKKLKTTCPIPMSQLAMSITALIHIECAENGKGTLYRAKRRFQLLMEYT
jgi:hypothetical protein